MKSIAIPTKLCLVLCAGCTSTPVFDVHQSKWQLSGVPFFVKIPEFTQSTNYEVRWIEATIEVKSGKDVKQTISRTLPESERTHLQALAAAIARSQTTVGEKQQAVSNARRSANELSQLNTMLGDSVPALKSFDTSATALQSAPNDANLQRDALRTARDVLQVIVNTKVDDLIAQFQALNQGVDFDVEADLEHGETGHIPRRLVGNNVASTPRIDYSTEHFINASVRPFTTTTQTVKLNGDLLLTESTTTVDATKQLDAITSLLPIKEFLTAKYVPDTPEASSELFSGVSGRGESTSPVTLTLAIETRGYLYTFIRTAADPDALRAVLPFRPRESAFKRTPLGEAGDKQGDKGDTVSFSGAIKLPKDDDAKPSDH